MNKLHFFDRLRERGTIVFRRFPLSILFAGIAAVFAMLSIQIDQTSFTVEAVSSGLAALIFAVGHISRERLLAGRKNHQVILFSALLVFSLLYYFYLSETDTSVNQVSSIRTSVLFFILSITFIALPTIRSRYTFSDTLVVFIKSIFTSILIAFVFFIGVAAVLSAFSTLFIQLSFQWYAHAAALIFIFFAPIYFLAGIPLYFDDTQTDAVEERITRPTLLAVLVDYIVVPLILIFTALLIVYIGVNITGEFWLDNLIEPMLISYVTIGFIALYLTEQSSKKWIRLFNDYFPYLLLVIAVFQSISSTIRSFELGLTHGRYFVLLFGVFAISSVFLYGFFNSRKKVIPFILVSLGAISILPFIDAVSIGISSQAQQLEDSISEEHTDADGVVVQNADFTHDEQIQITYSMNYLEQYGSLESFDFLPAGFNYYNDFETVFGFDPYYYVNNGASRGPEDPAERESAYIAVDSILPRVINVNEADELVFFSTYMLEENPEAGDIELNDPESTLVITTEESLIMLELFQNDELILNFDLTFLLQEAFVLSESDSAITLEDATFIEENEEAEVTVIINHFDTDTSGYYSGDFTVLINYK